MDLRKQKTQQSIREAFLALRSEKNVEQITVTELAKVARISKATFYLHYRDIYDLSEQLQQEAVGKVISHIPNPIGILEDLSRFAHALADALDKEEALLTPLFSGSQFAMIPIHLETQLKKHIFEKAPQLANDPKLNIQLSYHIHGGYAAFMENAQKLGKNYVLNVVKEMQENFTIIMQ